MMNLKEKTEEGMQAAIEHLRQELSSIRTGRAHPSLLDQLFVDVYGTRMRIRDMAAITVPEPRQLLITPYDKQTTAAIGKAIMQGLGFNPIVDANSVRLVIPEMDQSSRNEMIKLCHKKREEAKVAVRNVRAHSNKEAREEKAKGAIPEDELNRQEKIIQELTDKYCKIADEVCAVKEKEISTI
jgi:ribosome recycling factor